MARRNIAARLVLDSNGMWTLVEDTTVNRPQPVHETQTPNTTGSDDKVIVLGNQNFQIHNSVLPNQTLFERPLPVQTSNTTSNLNNSQLSASRSKLISTIACSIQPKTTDKQPIVSQHISSADVAPQVKAAVVSDPGLKHGYIMKSTPNDVVSKSNTQISNQLQVSVPPGQGATVSGISYDLLPRLLNEALQSEVEIPRTSGSECSGSTALTSSTMKSKPQQQRSGSAQEPTVIHVPSGTSKVEFDLSSFGKSILKNPVVQPQVQPVVQSQLQSVVQPQVQPAVQPQFQPAVQPQVQQVGQSQVHRIAPQSIPASRSANTGVYVGTFHVENRLQSPAILQKQQNIVPILSKYSKHLTNSSNSLNLQGNTRPVDAQAQSSTSDSQQLLILHPKPVATVKPEPATLLYQNPSRPVVSTSYVAMVPTGVPTYFHPVILNEPQSKSPPVAKTQLVTQRQDENDSSLKPTPDATKSISLVLTVPTATITPQKPSPGKEIFLPEVCEEVVVESAQTDFQESPLPRIESVFSLTHTEDTDTAEETIDDSLSLIERADDELDLNSSYDSESGKRRRKKPKRLIAEDFSLPSRRCPSKKKTFLKPVVFNPCFVVLERIVTDGNKNTRKKAKGKKGKPESNKKCTKICRERFLQRLCWKGSIPCNRYFDDSEDIKKMCIEHKYCKKQKPSTAGNLRLVIDDGTDNVSSHFERDTFGKQSNQKSDLNKNNNSQNTVFNNNYDSIPNVFSVPSRKKRRKCHVPTAACDMNVTGALVDNSFVNVSSSVPSSIDQDSNLLSAQVDVSARLGSASKYKLSIPKSPSSDTESALSESYIASEVESSPAKDLISVDSGTLPEHMSDTEDVANEVDETASTEGLQERSPSSQEPTEETDIDSPPKTPSPNPYQEIEDLLNQEYDYDKIRTEQAAKEDSDDDWGTNELEVDPDSDPDEGAPPSNVSLAVPPSLLPCVVSESVLDKETSPEVDSKDNENEAVPLRSPVLSERVQRLKEMLAEQSRQVDSLRRLRRRTK